MQIPVDEQNYEAAADRLNFSFNHQTTSNSAEKSLKSIIS